MSRPFWRNRRVLLTGHTGFKGAWLALWLRSLGAEVTGVSLVASDASGAYNAFSPWHTLTEHFVDIRDGDAVARVFRAAEPEVVFHLAAQPIVRVGYQDPVGTFETNVVGTANVLAAASVAGTVSACVVVTSDKVYKNIGDGRDFTEDDALGGEDPYSASKASCELVVSSWRRVHPDLRVVTARAGNVIGGGDRGQDRLVPDVLVALEAGEPVRLRNPSATRPWQFVLDPLDGYLRYAEALAEADSLAAVAPSLNFGPSRRAVEITVAEIAEIIMGRDAGRAWMPCDGEQPAEAQALHVDATRARTTLGWKQRLGVYEAIDWVLEWETAQRAGADARAVAIEQVERYEALAGGQ